MKKRIVFGIVFSMLVLSVSGCALRGNAPVPAKNDVSDVMSGETVTFNVNAKKFIFTPAEIRVKKGDNVIINVTSEDATHGFAIKEFGINETVKQGETKQIKFLADKSGTFTFFCSVPCGSGHLDMKGSLLVTPTAKPVENNPAQSVLDLSGRSLKQLPADVVKMTGLVELDISDNQFTGALPGEIRFLKKLKKLDASNNLMTGIPAEIGQLSELEELDYSGNQITGLPMEIANLKKLKTFDLTGNEYSKLDLAGIKKALPNLKVIGE